jgi:hypothetical protein
MTIDNHGGQDNQMNAYPGLQARAHSLVALEQSALYAARLAIARWINTSAQATASVDVRWLVRTSAAELPGMAGTRRLCPIRRGVR